MKIEDTAKKVSLVVGIASMVVGALLLFVNVAVGVVLIIVGYVFFQSKKDLNQKITANTNKNEVMPVLISTTTSGAYEVIEGFDKYEEPEQKKLSDSKILDKVKFKYKEMERIVDVYTGKRGDTFDGFCHKTGKVLTFCFKRINDYEVIQVSTGEVMTPMEWRYKLQGTKLAHKEIEKEKIKRKRDIEITEENKKSNEKLNSDMTTWLALTEPKPIVEFDGKIFALGGYFKSGNIDESKEKVTSRGGIIKKDPSAKVDYIVVNKAYGVNATYEKTIKRLIERDKCPLIISEEYWLESMK